ncbi:hypothetical protein E2C01_035268 [Portunus trituberculatus]|uniref:Uncharacterized protein n=1 Tax=Portunus trituberculatus TaxID=210409 RepID=A0A5B7F8W8_PORTR|nr:hypothetical protein [Portunus trituberculatus]
MMSRGASVTPTRPSPPTAHNPPAPDNSRWQSCCFLRQIEPSEAKLPVSGKPSGITTTAITFITSSLSAASQYHVTFATNVTATTLRRSQQRFSGRRTNCAHRRCYCCTYLLLVLLPPLPGGGIGSGCHLQGRGKRGEEVRAHYHEWFKKQVREFMSRKAWFLLRVGREQPPAFHYQLSSVSPTGVCDRRHSC